MTVRLTRHSLRIPLRRRCPTALAILAPLVLALAEPADVQLERAEPRPDVVETRSYGLAEGPYGSLLIRNAMLPPGHGGPGQGPVDILIRGNVIDDIRAHDPDRSAGVVIGMPSSSVTSFA